MTPDGKPADKRPTIRGEYDHVAWRSRDFAALNEAHETGCTVKEAEAMLVALGRLCGLDHLLASFNARRGRGGTRYTYRYEKTGTFDWRGKERRRKVLGQLLPFVSLPHTPMTPGGAWYSYLRVGLVLHELAHAVGAYYVTEARINRTYTVDAKWIVGHNDAFVALLDVFIAWWKDNKA